jgi:hypothetical protein
LFLFIVFGGSGSERLSKALPDRRHIKRIEDRNLTNDFCRSPAARDCRRLAVVLEKGEPAHGKRAQIVVKPPVERVC